jgi:transcriptional regulator with XRE-family HTH domain
MGVDELHNRSSVGYVIKKYRKARGITQKQLAYEIGVEARTLRMYENGERTLENITALQRIADLLTIDPVELGLAPRKHISHTATSVYRVIEQVRSLLFQARFVEAHTTVETLLKNLKSSAEDGESRSFGSLAYAHHIAAQVQAITRRTGEISYVTRHLQAMEHFARLLDDQTLLTIALAYQGDMARRRGDLAQCFVYLEQAREFVPQAHVLARGDHALLLGRAHLANNDSAEFEHAMAEAEMLARQVETVTDNDLTFYCLGTVYEEYVRGYARLGKFEQSLRYLELAETYLPANKLFTLILKADHAEALIFHGDILNGMPMLLEVVHLAQTYGHQRLQERLYGIQSYLDDQAMMMQRAARALRDALHGPVEL